MNNHPTKNTLLQAATSQPTKQSLQESIFSPTQEKLKNKKSSTLQKNKTSFHHTVQTSTDIALNVNRLGQSLCGLQAKHLRTDSRAAHNNIGFVGCGAPTMKPMLNETGGYGDVVRSYWSVTASDPACRQAGIPALF